jgi:hypothetical protein
MEGGFLFAFWFKESTFRLLGALGLERMGELGFEVFVHLPDRQIIPASVLRLFSTT